MNDSSLNPLRPWRHPLRLWLRQCFNVDLARRRRRDVQPDHRLARHVGRPADHVRHRPPVRLVDIRARPRVRPLRTWPCRRARRRARSTTPVPPLTAPSWWGRLKERAKSKPRWREIAYHLAHLPVAAIGYALTMAAWCGSLAMLLLPLYVDALPGDSAKFHFFEITQGAGAGAAALVGLLGLVLVAPWVTIGRREGRRRPRQGAPRADE